MAPSLPDKWTSWPRVFQEVRGPLCTGKQAGHVGHVTTQGVHGPDHQASKFMMQEATAVRGKWAHPQSSSGAVNFANIIYLNNVTCRLNLFGIYRTPHSTQHMFFPSGHRMFTKIHWATESVNNFFKNYFYFLKYVTENVF